MKNGTWKLEHVNAILDKLNKNRGKILALVKEARNNLITTSNTYIADAKAYQAAIATGDAQAKQLKDLTEAADKQNASATAITAEWNKKISEYSDAQQKLVLIAQERDALAAQTTAIALQTSQLAAQIEKIKANTVDAPKLKTQVDADLVALTNSVNTAKTAYPSSAGIVEKVKTDTLALAAPDVITKDINSIQ